MTITLQQPGGGAGRPELAETTPLVLCPACDAEARNRDRFCRRCGAHLSKTGCTAGLSKPADSASRYVTSPLAATVAQPRVSGALLASIAHGVSASLAVCPVNPAVRRIMIALVSIPIWLLIVLLSPLDAYVTARGTVLYCTADD